MKVIAIFLAVMALTQAQLTQDWAEVAQVAVALMATFQHYYIIIYNPVCTQCCCTNRQNLTFWWCWWYRRSNSWSFWRYLTFWTLSNQLLILAYAMMMIKIKFNDNYNNWWISFRLHFMWFSFYIIHNIDYLNCE